MSDAQQKVEKAVEVLTQMEAAVANIEEGVKDPKSLDERREDLGLAISELRTNIVELRSALAA